MGSGDRSDDCLKLGAWKTLRLVREARKKDYGKLVQKFLALAFLETGANRVTDRAVQGIDLEVVLADRSVAFEVKTTAGSGISVSSKDFDGLQARREEGFHTMLAVLGGQLTDEWLFLPVPGTDLRADMRFEINRMSPFADQELSQLVQVSFEQMVIDHGQEAIRGGQVALNRILEAYANYAIA